MCLFILLAKWGVQNDEQRKQDTPEYPPMLNQVALLPLFVEEISHSPINQGRLTNESAYLARKDDRHK